MACLVRDSRDEDLAQVQSIYCFHVRRGLASFEEQPPSVEEMKRRRCDVLGRGLPYLIAQTSGEIAGYAYAAPYRFRSAYRFTIEDSVYVDQRHYRCGVGRALLGELIGRCEKGPFRQMIAVIGDSDNISSIALHQRLGFRRVGHLQAVGFKFGRWVDSVLMQRALNVGDRDLPAESGNESVKCAEVHRGE
jgi:L-amino acid N-acyltransferase YncA